MKSKGKLLNKMRSVLWTTSKMMQNSCIFEVNQGDPYD